MRTKVYREYIDNIPYEIRKMRQARRMTLKVSAEGKVWVSMPPYASVRQARAFVEQHRAYVVRLVRDALQRRDALLDDDAPLQLPVKGEWFGVILADNGQQTLDIDSEQRIITLHVPPEENGAAQRRRALVFWQNCMIDEANRTLPIRTMHFAELLREPLRRISVRDQKTRWGSCSARNRSINLNWRCVLFPDDVRDYLILHEMAHLHHPNHSADFWRLVEQWCPDYRAADRWITDHGRRIMDVTATL